MNYRIFNVRTDVNAGDCTRGCTDTRKRVCTESWLGEKNPLLHQGIEPASAAWRSDARKNWATSPPPKPVLGIGVSPGETMLHPLMSDKTSVSAPTCLECFSLSLTRSQPGLFKEWGFTRRTKLVVKKVVYILSCTCWLAECGLSLESRWLNDQ